LGLCKQIFDFNDQFRLIDWEMEALLEGSIIQQKTNLLIGDVSHLQLDLVNDGHVNVRFGGSTILILLVGKQVKT